MKPQIEVNLDKTISMANDDDNFLTHNRSNSARGRGRGRGAAELSADRAAEDEAVGGEPDPQLLELRPWELPTQD